MGNTDKIPQGNIECPLCLGWGHVEKPEDADIEAKVKMAKSLKKAGFSFRQIMDLLGYKSPRSVSYLLNKKKN